MPIEGLKHELDAADRLVLVRVKIERAKKHLLDLEAMLRQFANERLDVVGTKGNLEAGEDRYFMVNLPILPFDVLATAGDLVHNLRSSLDHLAHQLVLVGSGREPSRRVEFPIAKDLAAYESQKAGKVDGMLEPAVKHIDSFKPYKGGNEFLWRIHELDSIDKHRTLFTVGQDLLLVADWLPLIGSPFWLKTGNPHFAGVRETDVEHDLEVEVQKAIGEAKIPQGNALLPSLQQLITFAEALVLSFEPYLAGG